MSFSKRQELPVLRRRRRSNKAIRRNANVKYHVHWALPTSFVIMVACCVIIYLCQCAQLIGVQYHISHLKEQKKLLLKEQKKVKLNIEKLESLERIEKIAKNDLKMVYPSTRLTLTLKKATSTAMASGEMSMDVP